MPDIIALYIYIYTYYLYACAKPPEKDAETETACFWCQVPAQISGGLKSAFDMAREAASSPAGVA